MSLTVKNLIDRYSKITESESEPVKFELEKSTDELSEEETTVLSALNMGVVTEKVLKSRRQARKKAC